MIRAERTLALAALTFGAAISFVPQTAAQATTRTTAESQTTTTQNTGVVEMSARKSTFDVSLLNGVPLHGETRGANGIDYQAVVAVTVNGSVSTLHRLVLDRTHHTWFGYTLFADRVAGSSQIHLHFGQLRGFSMFQGVDLTGFQPGIPPAPLADKTVEVGVPVTLPLERDSDGNELLQDTLNFGPPS